MSSGPPPRYTDRSFPAYRYRPGRTPHPTRHPQGHSAGTDAAPGRPEPARGPGDPRHLFAVDLFNAGYWWEAHEEWEALWRALGRDHPTGRFVQGLIQAAAALLKRELGAERAARGLARAACGKLRAPAAPVLGVDGRALAAALEARLAGEGPAPGLRLVGTGAPAPRGG